MSANPELQRKILHMFLVEGMALQEIADALGLRKSVVNGHCYRGRVKLGLLPALRRSRAKDEAEVRKPHQPKTVTLPTIQAGARMLEK